MNIIDLAVILVLAFFVLSGIYKGFLPTVMGIAANIVSWACGMIFMPIISNLVTGSAATSSSITCCSIIRREPSL